MKHKLSVRLEDEKDTRLTVSVNLCDGDINLTIGGVDVMWIDAERGINLHPLGREQAAALRAAGLPVTNLYPDSAFGNYLTIDAKDAENFSKFFNDELD
jgi:hypothetical protein